MLSIALPPRIVSPGRRGGRLGRTDRRRASGRGARAKVGDQRRKDGFQDPPPLRRGRPVPLRPAAHSSCPGETKIFRHPQNLLAESIIQPQGLMGGLNTHNDLEFRRTNPACPSEGRIAPESAARDKACGPLGGDRSALDRRNPCYLVHALSAWLQAKLGRLWPERPCL